MTGGDDALIGRAGEVRAVAAGLAGRQPVVLAGEAGIGKTSVLRAAAAGFPSGFREGGALASAAWMPYLAVRRAVGAVGTAGEDPMAVAVAVQARLRGGALLLDDLQWADEGTLRVAETLAGHVPIAAAVRDDGPESAAVLHRLRAAGFQIRELPPLADADAAALARRQRQGLSDAALRQVLRRAGGNPLLVGELARDGQVSSPFRLLLSARLHRLDPSVRQDFETLAVAGKPLPRQWFGPGSVAALTEASLADLDGSRLAVRHALLAEIAAAELDEDTRRDRHTRLAALVEHPGERARHLRAAGDVSGALAAAMAAVDTSASGSERAEHLALAAECATGADGDALRLAAAAALEESHSWDRLDAVLRELHSRDPQTLARAELLRARGAWAAGRPEVVRDAVQRGLERVAGSGTEVEVLLRIEACRVPIFLDGDVAGGVDAARAAVALAHRHGVGVDRAHYFLGTALGVADRPGWDRQLRLAMTVAARSATGADTEFAATSNLVTFHESAGSPATAREEAEAGAVRAEARGLLGWATTLRAMAVNLDMHAGDYPRVLEESERLLALPVDRRARDMLCQARGLALVDLGRTGEAAAAVAAHVPEAADDSRGAPSLLLVLAEAALWGGRPRRAATLADAYVEALADDPLNAVFGVLVRAWAALDLGEPVGPAPDVPGRAMLAAVPYEVSGLAALQRGDHRAADERLRAAAAAWSRYHVRGEMRCTWAAAEAVRRAGDTATAVPRLESLEARAAALGMVPLLGRIQRSLRRSGRRGPRPGRPVAGLSPRAVAVLELAADGLTTDEIAARLGVSRRTVAEHVRSAVDALGASSRAHAVALLAARRDTRTT